MQETGKIEILGGNPRKDWVHTEYMEDIISRFPCREAFRRELLLYRGNSQKPEKIIPLPEKERYRADQRGLCKRPGAGGMGSTVTAWGRAAGRILTPES